MSQDCLRSQGEKFVSALAVLAESLLFQMDELLTTDDVRGGSMSLAGAECLALTVEFHRLLLIYFT